MPFSASLTSAISGLTSHQTVMDTIANNIANVDTIGFKASRANLGQAFDQILQNATGPSALSGGTNPIQIGLGVSVQSISSEMTQGNLETTGQTTDLALQGQGFFIVNLDGNQYYTRAGSFQFDAQGRLIDPGTGAIVQGKTADAQGNLPVGSAVSDIVIPFGQKSPAKATSYIKLTGNLDSSQTPLGTIMESNSVYAVDNGLTDVNNLLAANNGGGGNHIITGMVPDSTTLTMTVDGTAYTYTYVTSDSGTGKGDFHTLQDLLNEVNYSLNQQFGGSSPISATMGTDGSITFANTGATSHTLQITSTNPVLQAALNTATPNTLAATTGTLTTQQFSHIATSADLLVNLRNATGAGLGLVNNDNLDINGDVGGTPITQGVLQVNAAQTTYGDLANSVTSAFGISNATGTTIDPQTGALTINADGGTAHSVSNIDITDGTTTTAKFNGVFSANPGDWSQMQAATDVQQNISTTIYDSLGNQYNVTLAFTRDVTRPNTWTWKATASSPAVITGGGSGTAVFNNDGSLNTFTFNDGSTTLQINPRAAGNSANLSADLMSIQLNVGGAGNFAGLTQMSGASTTVSGQQDGYGLGVLNSESIDQNGNIIGEFSNGTTRTLGQVMLATFDNPGGLINKGNNLYGTSASTGDPIIGEAGSAIPTQVVSGSLEQSNVNLATELSNMIVAERGFQANAKVITTSDTLLNTLVNSIQ
ncbi:MAG: flagellar hook-basal body complex protein [Bacteroidetes bacterium]|nr:flagellar hook-basal body complex protein [Bacteroidota bacterium]